MMRAEAVYRALLYCYPAAFRHEYGDQMLLMFVDQLSDARRSGGVGGRAGLWLRATLDALIVAPREHGHVILQDLRYAARSMAATPGFVAVAVLSLALGIGANTAIFSLWNGVLHSRLPAVHEPERLVMLTNPDESGGWTGRWDGADGPRSWITYEEFEELRDHAEGFSGLMASQSGLNTWTVRFQGGGGEEARGRLVSGGFFEVLGVGAHTGRVFTAADDHAARPEAVISYRYWQRRFGGRPDVLGQTFTLRQAALTIIGVAPSGFIGETSGQEPDLWLPLRMQPYVLPGKDRLHDTPPEKVMWLQAFGRLRPGVTLVEADARANAVFQAGLESFYGGIASGPRRREFLDQRLQVRSGARGASRTRHEFSHSLTALLAAVGVLLLIACANLANLLLARAAARKPEIALRLALGASRGRLVRQLVTESLALAALGGAAAVAVAFVLHGALVRLMGESDPRFQMSFDLGPAVVAFILAVTLGAALVFGVLPAWQGTRADAGESLKLEGRGGMRSVEQMRSGRLLVGLQLALSLPLLVGAGLLARTVHNLQRADLGFPAERLLLARVDLQDAVPDRMQREGVTFDLLSRLGQIPGVRAASFSNLGVFSGGNSHDTIEVEGYTPKGDNDRGSDFDTVGPAYFSTLGVPILRGREILEQDRATGAKVCVINEAFARLFFAGRNPLGMRVTPVEDGEVRTSYEIVGVVGNARTQGLRDEVETRFFAPAVQRAPLPPSPTFFLRTGTDVGPVKAAVLKTVQELNPALQVLSAQSVGEQMAPLTAQDRTTARLAVVFACVALALAAIGLYGVLSYGVARRGGEIAIRIALGAYPARVIAMILRETLRLVAVGLVVGGGLAYVASRIINSRLYGVAPQDPATLAAAVALLLPVALGAAYLPARRASRLDPMVVLRQG